MKPGQDPRRVGSSSDAAQVMNCSWVSPPTCTNATCVNPAASNGEGQSAGANWSFEPERERRHDIEGRGRECSPQVDVPGMGIGEKQVVPDGPVEDVGVLGDERHVFTKGRWLDRPRRSAGEKDADPRDLVSRDRAQQRRLARARPAPEHHRVPGPRSDRDPLVLDLDVDRPWSPRHGAMPRHHGRRRRKQISQAGRRGPRPREGSDSSREGGQRLEGNDRHQAGHHVGGRPRPSR